VNQLRVRTLYDYRAQRLDELSFPKNACITDVQKQDGGWWVLVSLVVSVLLYGTQTSKVLSEPHKPAICPWSLLLHALARHWLIMWMNAYRACDGVSVYSTVFSSTYCATHGKNGQHCALIDGVNNICCITEGGEGIMVARCSCGFLRTMWRKCRPMRMIMMRLRSAACRRVPLTSPASP